MVIALKSLITSMVTLVPWYLFSTAVIFLPAVTNLECNTNEWAIATKIFRDKCAAEWSYHEAMSVGVTLQTICVIISWKISDYLTVTKSIQFFQKMKSLGQVEAPTANLNKVHTPHVGLCVTVLRN